MKANYTEGEIAQALSLATVALLLLAHMFFVSMSRYDEAEETLTLLRHFQTLLRQLRAAVTAPQTE